MAPPWDAKGWSQTPRATGASVFLSMRRHSPPAVQSWLAAEKALVMESTKGSAAAVRY